MTVTLRFARAGAKTAPDARRRQTAALTSPCSMSGAGR